jgi:hypothetical protein
MTAPAQPTIAAAIADYAALSLANKALRDALYGHDDDCLLRCLREACEGEHSCVICDGPGEAP